MDKDMALVWRLTHRTRVFDEDHSVAGHHVGPSYFGVGWYAWGMPVPNADGLGYPRRTEVCGFASLEKAAKWFHRDVPRLKEHDAVVRVFAVPVSAVRHGGEQVVFDVTKAKEVALHEPDILSNPDAQVPSNLDDILRLLGVEA